MESATTALPSGELETLVGEVRRHRNLVIAVGLFAALVTYGAVRIDGFTSSFSIDAMFVLGSFLGIAAVGQTLAALVGGIDLSIPFVIGMANVMLAELSGRGWSSPATIAVIIVVAGFVGLTNGALSWWLGLHPLLITLGVGFAVQGAVQIWTSGNVEGGAPKWISDLVRIDAETFGVVPFPPVVIVWLVLAVVVLFVLHWTPFGRWIYAVGNNALAADRALIDRRLVWLAMFTLSAMFAAIAGIMLGGFTGGGFVTVGDPYLFTTIVAVVIGGTSLLGGSGGYGLTMLGVAVLTVLTQILVGEGLSADMQKVVMGVLIVAMVSLYARESHPSARV